MASPFGLANHVEDGVAHCVKVSMSGAAALRRRKIQAEAIPCAIIGSKHENIPFFVGLSAKEIHHMYPDKTFDVSTVNPFPMYMVIEARFAGERAVIDLSCGHLRQSQGIDVPMFIVGFGKGWPKRRGKDWRLVYMASPHAAQIRTETKEWTAKDLTNDLNDLIEAALEGEGPTYTLG